MTQKPKLTNEEVCASKAVFPTRKVAKAFIRRESLHGKMFAYRCPCSTCDGWHLTSKSALERAKSRMLDSLNR